VFACTSFLVSGIFNGGIGPVLGELSARTGSSLSAAGGVITFLFLGALITQVVGGPIADRVGLKAVLVAAFSLLAIGLTGFTRAPTLAWVYFFFLIAGLGQGCMNLGTNLVVAKAYPQKSTSFLNLLHFFFGLGAFSGPAIISLVISLKSPGLLVHEITAELFLVISLLYLVLYRNSRPEKANSTFESEKPKFNLYRSPFLWTLGFMLLVYVGFEYGIGSWTTTLMGVTAKMAVQNGALITSAYWGVFTIGRLSGTFLSRKLSIHKLLMLTIFGALFFSIAFTLLLGNEVGSILALVFIALCLGPIFPTTVAFTTQSFPQDQGKAFGLVGAMSSIGGLSLPLLDGFFLENHNALGFALFNVGILIALVGFFFLGRSLLKKAAVSTQ
jgi:fucose permease